MTVRRIAVYGRARPHDLEACAASMADVLERLVAVSEAFAFTVRSRGPLHGRPLDSRKACAAALAQGEVSANMGDAAKPMRLYGVRLASSEGAQLDLVAGIDIDTVPLWRANRVELTLAEPTTPRETLAALAALVGGFGADWGFAGGELVPALPPFGPGTPAVGWMTFLSMRHGALPALAAPASVMPVEGGAIVLSQPEPFDERRARDLENVQAVRAALGARVLQRPPLPFAEIDPAVPPAEVHPPPAASRVVEEPDAAHQAPARVATPAPSPAPPSPPRAVAPAPQPPAVVLQASAGDRPLARTVGGVREPFPMNPTPMPFVAPARPIELPPPSQPVSSVRGGTAIATDGFASGPALPFAGSSGTPPPDADALRRKFSLPVYAAVCAELRLYPERAATVFKRYGLADPVVRAVVNASYMEDLERDPAMRTRFDELVARAQASLR